MKKYNILDPNLITEIPEMTDKLKILGSRGEEIYIIPNYDKPVKLIIEDNSQEFRTEKRYPTKQEVLTELIRCRLRHKLTTQQYRSEMGKIRKNKLDDVINFISKYNMYEWYISKLNTEIEEMIITRKMGINTDFLDAFKYGVIHLDK